MAFRRSNRPDKWHRKLDALGVHASGSSVENALINMCQILADNGEFAADMYERRAC
jgi:hypothetical protein